jgi:hypothetical protein
MSFNFEGHQCYKIDTTWMLDLTTFTGYKIFFDKNNNPVDAVPAFQIVYDPDSGLLRKEKFIKDIPIGVMRKCENIIHGYYSEAYVG